MILSKLKNLIIEKNKIYKNIFKLKSMAKSSSIRHNDRPHTIDYVNNIFEDIIYLHMVIKNMLMTVLLLAGLQKLNNNYSIIFIGYRKRKYNGHKNKT